MNVKQQVKDMLEAEHIQPGRGGHLQPTKYLAGMNLLYRQRPDLCKGREFVAARQAVIEHAKGEL